MRRLWHDIRVHRLAVALFVLFWLITALITVVTWDPNRMPTIVWVLHLIVVIAAAALVAWWRDADEKAMLVCLGIGALIGVVEIWVIMLAGDLGCWLADCPPVPVPADEEPAWVFLLLLSMIASVIGLVLGLLGWLAAVILASLYRGRSGQGGPAAPTGVA